MNIDKFRQLRFSKKPDWVQQIYTLDLKDNKFVIRYDIWSGSEYQLKLLVAGFIHTDIKIAEAYAKELNNLVRVQESCDVECREQMQQLLDRYK